MNICMMYDKKVFKVCFSLALSSFASYMEKRQNHTYTCMQAFKY